MEAGEFLEILGVTPCGVERRPTRDVHLFRDSDRRGWIWIEKCSPNPVAHLSLVVSEGHDLDRLRQWIQTFPPILVGSLDAAEHSQGAVLRIIDRYPIRGRSESIAARYQQIRSTASAIAPFVGKDLPRGDAAVNDLSTVFVDSGLPPPPLPVDLRRSLTRMDRWWWGSTFVPPGELYLYEPVVDSLINAWDRRPVFAVAHAGHGANSYALHLLVAKGPVSAFVQCGFVGVYMDPIFAAGELGSVFVRLKVLMDGVPNLGPALLLVLCSTLAGVHRLVDLGSPDTAQDFEDVHALFSAAAARFPAAKYGAGGPVVW